MRTLERGPRGFTLIELLVALLIFGIFSVLAYSGLTRLLDGRARLNEQQRVWQQLGQVFMRISDDVPSTWSFRFCTTWSAILCETSGGSGA